MTIVTGSGSDLSGKVALVTGASRVSARTRRASWATAAHESW
ncbi:hypothetical protein [Saccharopolyspora pogona]|nr:hypothetical protein [Saccharopolyspora pogona]